MTKEKKKSAKKASKIFHDIINASVQPKPKAITPPKKDTKSHSNNKGGK